MNEQETPFDVDAQDELDEKQKLSRLQQIEDIRELGRTGAGLRFLRRLFKEGYVLECHHFGNSKDSFMAGRRGLACGFLGDVQTAFPDTWRDYLI